MSSIDFNIPTTKNINGKEYKFTKLTIYQIGEWEKYCKQLVKEELKADALDAGVTGRDLLEVLKDATDYQAIETKKFSAEGSIYLVKKSLEKYQTPQVIEELFSTLDLNTLVKVIDIIVSVVDDDDDEVEPVKKTKPIQRRKKP